MMDLDSAIQHCEEVAYQKDLESGFETDNERYAMTDKERADCKECAEEHRQLAKWLRELKAYKEQSGDAISRQAVLDIITFEDKWLLDTKGHNANTHIAFSGLESRVKDLPSVTPQQRTGRWVKGASYGDQYNYYQSYVCSCCKHGYDVHGWNYCPNCGAKMQEE